MWSISLKWVFFLFVFGWGGVVGTLSSLVQGIVILRFWQLHCCHVVKPFWEKGGKSETYMTTGWLSNIKYSCQYFMFPNYSFVFFLFCFFPPGLSTLNSTALIQLFFLLTQCAEVVLCIYKPVQYSRHKKTVTKEKWWGKKKDDICPLIPLYFCSFFFSTEKKQLDTGTF